MGGRRPALEERPQAGPGQAGPAGGGARGGVGAGPVSRKAFMIEFFDEANPRKRRSYSFSQTAPLMGEGQSPTPPSRRAPGDCAKGGVSAGVASAMAAVAPTAARLLLKPRPEGPPAPVQQQPAPADPPKTAPRPAEREHEDDQSDKGTYTIELDKPSAEEEEARRMIDKVTVCTDTSHRYSPKPSSDGNCDGMIEWGVFILFAEEILQSTLNQPLAKFLPKVLKMVFSARFLPGPFPMLYRFKFT